MIIYFKLFVQCHYMFNFINVINKVGLLTPLFINAILIFISDCISLSTSKIKYIGGYAL